MFSIVQLILKINCNKHHSCQLMDTGLQSSERVTLLYYKHSIIMKIILKSHCNKHHTLVQLMDAGLQSSVHKFDKSVMLITILCLPHEL